MLLFCVPNTVFFGTFKRLFAGLLLSFQELKTSRSFFQQQNMTWETAFKVIEIELGFAGYLFYTKTAVSHTYMGSSLRLVSFSSTMPAFLAFLMIHWNYYARLHLNFDANITCLLLAGAVLVEIYGIFLLISSDLTLLLLSKHDNLLVDFTYKAVSCLQSCLQCCPPIPAANKRWSNSIARFNLLRFCLKGKRSKFSLWLQKFLNIYDLLERCQHTELEDVSGDMKKLVLEHLLNKSRNNDLAISISSKLCAQRGDSVLKEMGCTDRIGWSVDAEFDQSFLLRHIATDLCYYSDLNRNQNISDNPACKARKSLSEYMLYLMVMCPFMMPNGIGQLRFQDSCEEAIQFFEEKPQISDQNRACVALLQVNTDILPYQVKGDRSKSVLFDACRLAKSLQALETEIEWPNGKKWEKISQVWVEMLCHAANQCQCRSHVK